MSYTVEYMRRQSISLEVNYKSTGKENNHFELNIPSGKLTYEIVETGEDHK